MLNGNLPPDADIDGAQSGSPGYSNDVAVIERQYKDNISKQFRRLEEVGLSIDPPTPNERILHHLQDISGTEDIQRAMDEMNNNIKLKNKQKALQQQ